MPIENELTVRWGGVEFRQSQLTAADMIVMEEEWGDPFTRIDFDSMKAICWLVWLIRRHNEPELSLDDVTSITLDALAEDAQANKGDTSARPTSGSRKRASKSGNSGGRTTANSSASARGK